MHVVLNGWFAGRSVGSGQYTDRLLEALRRSAGADEVFDIVTPPPRAGRVRKVVFEQITFPRASRRADVAHVPYWAPPLAPRIPTVVTIHDLIPLVLPAYRRRLDVRLYTSLVARATRGAAAVIADSAHTAADISARIGVPADRVHVVPLAAGAEFHPAGDGDPDADREVAAALALPERFGLYLGGFDPRKDVPTLLAAWRGVHAACGAVLVIVGRPPRPGDTLAGTPAEIARRVGLPRRALRLVGAVDDAALPALYRAASVFAYPSRYEGFGLPPLEALASGTPVVACDATSLPEVVGDAGLLVPAGDVAAWTDALLRVFEDAGLAARLRAAGPARAAGFTWQLAAARTRAVYESVTRLRPDPRHAPCAS